MNPTEKQDACIEQIREILLSDSLPCWDEASNFFARLITITQLQEIQEDEPALSEQCRELIRQGLEKIKELSPQLKKWVLSEARSDNHHEFYLIKFILLNQSDIKTLQHYPYLIAYEWKVEALEAGRLRPDVGDLVLMDEHHRFLVVEVKYIDEKASGNVARKKRNQRRNKVCKQAMKYGKLFKIMFPWAVVLKGAFTTASLEEKLSLKFKNYCKAEEKIRKAKERALLLDEQYHPAVG
ncbi:MAG: hypothetical protein ICV63_11530 [Coleofasciculus sp. Co-bin14]|nr:hypothetical protein [Coleofasciculus sp. Co-bin14]